LKAAILTLRAARLGSLKTISGRQRGASLDNCPARFQAAFATPASRATSSTNVSISLKIANDFKR